MLERHEGSVFASLLWLHHSYFLAGTNSRVAIVLGRLKAIVADWARAEASPLPSQPKERIGELLYSSQT